MGQVDQVTPDGALTYTQTGSYDWTDPNSGRTYSLPRYTATTTLSPEAQALRDANNRGNLALANLGADQAARAGDLLSRPMDTSNLPARADRSGQAPAEYGPSLTAPTYSTAGTPLPNYRAGASLPGTSSAAAAPTTSARATLPGFEDIEGSAGLRTGYENDFSADRQRVEDTLMERLAPGLARDRENMERNLANRGIKLGSDEYDRAMGQVDRATQEARLSAILGAGQEQSRLAGLARDEASFGNTALQQEYLNRTGATQYGNENDARLYALDEDARRYGDEQAIRLFGLGEDVRRYDDAQAMDRYTRAEDRARYEDTQADQTYALSEDQRRYGDTIAGQQFADRQAIQGRSDAITDARFSQLQQLLDAQDRQRAQAMQEEFAVRNQPINEIAALLSGSQVQTPNFAISAPSSIPTTDVAGITQQGYANQMQAYQAKLAQQQPMMGGLFGLGSTLIGPGGWLGKATT